MDEQENFVAWSFESCRWRVWKAERRVRWRYRARLRMAVGKEEKKRIRAERKQRICRIRATLSVAREKRSPYSLYQTQSAPGEESKTD